MSTKSKIAVALLAAVAISACDNRNTQSQTPPAATAASEPAVPTPSQTDLSFVDTAAIAGMFEVESSKLALSRATKPALKEFAQMMVDDHTKAQQELQAMVVAGQIAGVNHLPAELDGAHKTKLDDLAAASNGDGFDTRYQTLQLEAHQTAVTLFENEANNGSNAALKTWAAQTLPKLKDHLARIQAIAGPSN